MTSLRARQINRDIRNRDAMTFAGVLADPTEWTERAWSGAMYCPHCAEPTKVYPSRMDEHMALYHKDVTMKPTLQIDLTGSALTKDDAQRYVKRNAEIKAAMASLVIMAEALADIRDNRLYREHYPSFEAYCRGEWGKSRGWGNSRASAATIIEILSPFVDSDQLPVRESQTRALSSEDMPEGFVADVWTLALNTTPNHDPKEVTAAHLRNVTEVVNEAIVTEGYVDPGTGESEPVSPVAFKAAVLATTVEKLSRQWEHMTRKRQTVYKGENRVLITPTRNIEIILPPGADIAAIRAAIASGKPITVTLTTPKETE